MTVEQLQVQCELGQQQLMRMEYLEAEATLAAAESQAWAARDWDTLSRLYMPLQEARRQKRQRSGEGVVCLDLIAEGPDDTLDARHVLSNFPHGQLLAAGWASFEPAVQVRRLAAQHGLFVESFLAAVFPSDAGRLIAIIPLAAALPDSAARSAEEWRRILPSHSLLVSENQLPRGSHRGTVQTYARVMAMWEQLHAPFLQAADAQADPVAKMEGYRTAIRVDNACELAHQRLSDVARALLHKTKR